MIAILTVSKGLKFDLASRKVVEKDVWMNEESTKDHMGFRTWPKVESGQSSCKIKELERKFR